MLCGAQLRMGHKRLAFYSGANMQFIHLPHNAKPEQYATWHSAALHSAQADPFSCTPAWQLAFHDAFGPKRRLLFAEADGSVIALAEGLVSEEEIYITPLEPSWFFGCPLLGSNAPQLFAEAMHFFAGTYAPRFPKVLVGGLGPGLDYVQNMLNKTRMPLQAHLVKAGIQGSASLAGGLDGYLSRRSANLRRNLKRSATKAHELGIYYERVLPSTEDEAKATFSRMIAVERTSWKGIDHCGMAEPGICDFYAFLLLRLAPENGARVIFARCEDTDVGFIFGGLAGDIYRGQQFSYAQDCHELSLGNLMQIEKIRWLCEEGVQRYDMGPLDGPKMQYKTHWTETAFPIRTWLIEKA